MNKNLLSITEERKMEETSNTDVDEQGVDKGEALLSSDVSAADIEKIQGGEVGVVNTSTMPNAQFKNIKNGMKRTREKLLSTSFFESAEEFLMTNLIGSTTAGAMWNNAPLRDASPLRTGALNGIMEALTCGHNNTIGVCELYSFKNDNLVEKVSRSATRDRLFDVVIMASVSQEPNNKRIQDAVAEALGFTFDDDDDEKDLAKRSTRLHIGQAFCLKFDDDEKKDAAERAERLRNRILIKQKILVILHDLHERLDLDKVGLYTIGSRSHRLQVVADFC